MHAVAEIFHRRLRLHNYRTHCVDYVRRLSNPVHVLYNKTAAMIAFTSKNTRVLYNNLGLIENLQ